MCVCRGAEIVLRFRFVHCAHFCACGACCATVLVSPALRACVVRAQECEIVDMLGGARYRRRERRGSAVQHTTGGSAQDSKLEDTFYAPTQKERNRNLVRRRTLE